VIGAVAAGIAGPAAAALLSWVAAERTWRREPARLTSVMTAAFAGKVVFFAAYVAFMLSVLSLPPVPFAATFTASFVTLHLVEALALKRLFSR
jgi:hypothetical protein